MVERRRCHDWVRTDMVFPARRAVVRVRQWFDEWDSLTGLLDEAAQDVEKVKAAEAEIGRRIAEIHPQLQNCCVHFIGFDFPRGEWRIGISHPSLAAVEYGEECPVIPQPLREVVKR